MAVSKGKAGLAATVGTATAALLLSMVGGFEGKVNSPHWDRYAKIWDVCYGETRVPMRTYSDEACADMLATGLDGFAQGVLKRNPELRGHPNQLAAAISLTYNIGQANYNRSTVAKRFSAGDWKGACNAFLAWDMAGGQRVPGLAKRRRSERLTCLKGLS